MELEKSECCVLGDLHCVRYIPRMPKRKFIVTTIMLLWAASTVPSYKFPEFHSYDSPWMYTKVAIGLSIEAPDSSANKHTQHNWV